MPSTGALRQTCDLRCDRPRAGVPGRRRAHRCGHPHAGRRAHAGHVTILALAAVVPPPLPRRRHGRGRRRQREARPDGRRRAGPPSPGRARRVGGLGGGARLPERPRPPHRHGRPRSVGLVPGGDAQSAVSAWSTLAERATTQRLHGEVGGWVTPVLCLAQRDDRPHRRHGAEASLLACFRGGFSLLDPLELFLARVNLAEEQFDSSWLKPGVTPSLPSRSGAGNAGKRGTGRPRRPRKKEEIGRRRLTVCARRCPRWRSLSVPSPPCLT
jgi:hypothetical protein